MKRRPPVIIHDIESTAVARLAYSARTRQLRVWFTSNPALEYTYFDVPLQIVGTIFRSRSRGKALNRHVIGKLEFIKKEETSGIDQALD